MRTSGSRPQGQGMPRQQGQGAYRPQNGSNQQRGGQGAGEPVRGTQQRRPIQNARPVQSIRDEDFYNQETVEMNVPNDYQGEYEEGYAEEYNGDNYGTYDEGYDNGYDNGYEGEYEGNDIMSGAEPEGPSIQEEIIHRRNVIAYQKIEEAIIQNNLAEEEYDQDNGLGVSSPDDGYTYEEDMSSYEKKGMSTNMKVACIAGAVIVVLIGVILVLKLFGATEPEPVEPSSSLVSELPMNDFAEELSGIQADINGIYTDSHKVDTVEGTSQGSIDLLMSKVSEFEVKTSETTEYSDTVTKIRKELDTLNKYLEDKRILTDLTKPDVDLAGADFVTYLATVKSSVESYAVEGLRVTNNTKISRLQGFVSEYNKLKSELQLSNIQDISTFDQTSYTQRIGNIPYTKAQEELTGLVDTINKVKEEQAKAKTDEEKEAYKKQLEEEAAKQKEEWEKKANDELDKLKQQLEEKFKPTPTPDVPQSQEPSGDDDSSSSSMSVDDLMNMFGGLFNQGGDSSEVE